MRKELLKEMPYGQEGRYFWNIKRLVGREILRGRVPCTRAGRGSRRLSRHRRYGGCRPAPDGKSIS